MNNELSKEEQAALDKMAKAASVHYVLLVVLIGLGGIAFLLPDDMAPFAIVGVAVLLTLAGISSVHLQLFQRCPRCTARIARTQGFCSQCSLRFHSTSRSGSSSDEVS